jgi:hypothetical protein
MIDSYSWFLCWYWCAFEIVLDLNEGIYKQVTKPKYDVAFIFVHCLFRKWIAGFVRLWVYEQQLVTWQIPGISLAILGDLSLDQLVFISPINAQILIFTFSSLRNYYVKNWLFYYNIYGNENHADSSCQNSWQGVLRQKSSPTNFLGWNMTGDQLCQRKKKLHTFCSIQCSSFFNIYFQNSFGKHVDKWQTGESLLQQRCPPYLIFSHGCVCVDKTVNSTVQDFWVIENVDLFWKWTGTNSIHRV